MLALGRVRVLRWVGGRELLSSARDGASRGSVGSAPGRCGHRGHVLTCGDRVSQCQCVRRMRVRMSVSCAFPALARRISNVFEVLRCVRSDPACRVMVSKPGWLPACEMWHMQFCQRMSSCMFVLHVKMKVWYPRGAFSSSLVYTRRQTVILRQSRMVLSRLAESTTSLRDFSR